MRISTKGRYGLRALLVLARNFGQGPTLASGIAAQEEVSPKYLHALLNSLRTAGLVRSVRGSGGGYMLARSPNEIRLDEVIIALEGPIELVDCVGSPEICKRSATCPAHKVWTQLSDDLHRGLKRLTLADLAEDRPALARFAQARPSA